MMTDDYDSTDRYDEPAQQALLDVASNLAGLHVATIEAYHDALTFLITRGLTKIEASKCLRSPEFQKLEESDSFIILLMIWAQSGFSDNPALYKPDDGHFKRKKVMNASELTRARKALYSAPMGAIFSENRVRQRIVEVVQAAATHGLIEFRNELRVGVDKPFIGAAKLNTLMLRVSDAVAPLLVLSES
jgi:hypothetical protein